MQVEFVIGPAGSGKTFRCLEQVRSALKASPEGPPLLFLAPKQATFQLERELLSDPELPGYTRLQILSFDRLAEFVLDNYFAAPPRLLSEEGRVMVLRAILSGQADRLRLFRASARLPGFARELSKLVRELQTHKIGPDELQEAARRSLAPPSQKALPHLADKLHDLALMLGCYGDWLKEHKLEDPNRLHELATEALQGEESVRIAGLWMDGFAEMTPCEVDLLAAIVPHCEQATLAFCLDHVPTEDAAWLSCWSVLSQTFRKCFQAIAATKPKVTLLAREPKKSRFANSAVLLHLEEHWSDPAPAQCSDTIRAYQCANPEAEAALAAEQILNFVRNEGGRFRETAVLVRRLDNYHDALRRVFARAEIPFFLDRREPVSHHPLAELTRYALRTITFGWKIDDWFGALKSGLMDADESALDDLEIESIARGWRGDMWLKPMLAGGERFEPLRKEIVPPFATLRRHLGAKPTGHELGNALRTFWETLGVERTLTKWENPVLHATVWSEMLKWLDNVELAFGSGALPMREWLPIIETGLGTLTVGVVPPALDQVLIGSVDRSRNPNLRLAIVLGMNDGVFPESPSTDGLLTDHERDALHDARLFLGPNAKRRIGHERFYAYIACTRSCERLVLACSQFDGTGTKLNPPPFIDHVRRLFADLELKAWTASKPLPTRLEEFPVISPDECLSPEVAEELYGPELHTSVTRIEQFAACPFRFFITSGLHAQEERIFEVDAKKRGQFQHEVLRRFHESLSAEGRRWKDLTPTQARERIRQLANDHARDFEAGLFMESERDRFAVGQLTAALEQFVEKLVGWMREKYLFEPAHVELKFHDASGQIPAWRLPLANGRQLVFTGSIDRVDLFPVEKGEALCVVIDYKSSERKIEPILLANGIQMQLPAYLSVLRQLKEPTKVLRFKKIIPAGVFYVNLRAGYRRHSNRKQALGAQPEGFEHVGRFDHTHLERLDARALVDGRGDQFNYSITTTNAISRREKDPMPQDEFLKLLDLVETHLKNFGERIYRGAAQVSPYRNGSKTPCMQCDYRPICRFDPWEQSYRALKEADA